MQKRAALTLLTAIVVLAGTTHAPRAQEAEVAVFKSGVEQIAVAAVVRDAKGRLVKTLSAPDFELFDNGRRQTLTSVWSEPSPASVAILMDASGSMATKMDRARETANALVAGLTSGTDEAAFYTFDTSLREVRPFSAELNATGGAWNATRAWGATSLWDAIAETAQRIADRQRRRALVVITDGVDSASRMTPSDVSAIASSLDVPVYVLALQHLRDEELSEVALRGPLANLAAWTGGEALTVRDAAGALSATRRILAELHHQYVLAFEPSSTPGWHPLIVKVRKPGLVVRARSGYIVP